MYVLDTCVCIELLRGQAPRTVERLRSLSPQQVVTTAVTAAELRYGAVHSAHPHKNLTRTERFLAPLSKLPFDVDAAHHYARVRHDLARRGQLIGVMDLLIAATALACGGTVVTDNLDEFERVPGLAVESW